MGERYKLIKLLGHGSFSSVCLALDAFTDEKVCRMQCPTLHTRCSALPNNSLESRPCMCWRMRAAPGSATHIICASPSVAEVMHAALKRMPDALSSLKQDAGWICILWRRTASIHVSLPPAVLQVALKRIPDVLSSPEQAKRVLREVCILRRLKHPFLINLRDAFTQPSTCGKPLCLSQQALPFGTQIVLPLRSSQTALRSRTYSMLHSVRKHQFCHASVNLESKADACACRAQAHG